MSKTKTLVKNTFFKATSQIAITLSHFVLIPIILKYLGVKGLGVMAILKLLTPEGPIGLLEFGIQSALVPFSAQLYADKKFQTLSRIITQLTIIFFAMGCFSLILFFIPPLKTFLELGSITDDVYTKIILYTLISNLFLFPKLIFQGFFEGLQNYKAISIIDGFQIIITNIGQVLLLIAGFHLVEVILLEAILGAAATLIYAGLSIKYLNISKLDQADKKSFKELLKTSKYVFIGRFSGLFSTNFDKIVIAKFFGAQFLGMFDIMMRLPKLLRLFTGIGTLTVTPMTAKLYAEKDHTKLNWLFEKGLFINMAINAGIIFNAIVFVPSFFNLWIGKEFSQHILGTQLLLVWTYFFAFNIGWNMLFGMNRLIKTSTAINWSGTIIKVITFFLTYKWLHENSIMAAYLVPQFLAFVGLYYFLREFQLPFKQFLRDFFITLFSFIPSFFFSKFILQRITIHNYIQLISLSSISLLLYFLTVYLLYPERLIIKDLFMVRLKKKSAYS